MFRCKYVLCTILFWNLLFASAFADTIKTKAKKFSYLNFATISLSYVSWGEKVALSQGALTDKAHGNMLGNALGLEWEHYFEPRYGFVLQGSFLMGVADVGGTQAVLTYNQVNQHWWGAGATARMAYRFSKWAISSMGPIFIYRDLTLPNDPSGTSAKSVASENVGGTIDLRMRLTDTLEVREEFGALALNASSYWALGLGYKF
jgi:hypothetical protein